MSPALIFLFSLALALLVCLALYLAILGFDMARNRTAPFTRLLKEFYQEFRTLRRIKKRIDKYPNDWYTVDNNMSTTYVNDRDDIILTTERKNSIQIMTGLFKSGESSANSISTDKTRIVVTIKGWHARRFNLWLAGKLEVKGSSLRILNDMLNERE